MSVIKRLFLRSTILYFLACSSFASAQVAVKGAQWTSVDNFKFCGSGDCETFRAVDLKVNSIEIGQEISITNLETGMEITKFVVRSIKYGRQVNMCWIGDSEGLSKTYITVSGCKR